ncbi:MAG: NUDIX hydrolase YfcD [Acidobacteria bacterium]|nr:NUDIX hydrolase YfcD [Acidobacteriota bacterium]
MYAPHLELVAIVDEANRVVGSATRAEMRRNNLPHRATYIFVFDRQGRIYAQHRTIIKDVYPGYWDLAAGGVVLAGESYGESAVRELDEELGIRGVTLEPWGEFYFHGEGCRVFGSAFSCTYEGPLTLQPEEVQAVELLTLDQVLAPTPDRDFTPDSLFALRRRIETPRA